MGEDDSDLIFDPFVYFGSSDVSQKEHGSVKGRAHSHGATIKASVDIPHG